MKKFLAFLTCLLFLPPRVEAQSVIQWGTITPGHVVTWQGQQRIQDGGSPSGTCIGDFCNAVVGTGLAKNSDQINLKPGTNLTIGGVQAVSPVAHEWIRGIVGGVALLSQPTVVDIGGLGTGVAAALAAAVNGSTGFISPNGLASGTCSNALALNSSGDPILIPCASGGNVSGPASSVQNDVAYYADSTGKVIADSGVPFQQLARMISGASYGMKCDGTTNDYTSLFNAYSAAVALNATLELPGGNCLFGTTLNLVNASRIIGQGKQLTTLTYTGSGSAGLFLQSATLGIQLSNFGISSSGTVSIQIGDATHTVAYAYLDNLAFGAGTTNVLFENCSVCRIQNSDFNAGYTVQGIEIAAPLNPDNLDSFIGPNNLIIGSNLTSVAGIVHVGGGGWHIHDDKIITNQYGILFEESLTSGQVASAQTITDDSIEGCGTECIAFSNQSSTVGGMLHVVISGNQINAGPTSGGIGIGFAANARTWLTNVAITGNEITTCTAALAITLNSIAQFSVTGNEVNDCHLNGTTGVNIAATATTGLVTGNTISGYTNKTVNSSSSVVLTANGP